MRKYTVAVCRFPGNGWEHSGLATWLMGLALEMKADERIDHMDLVVEGPDTPITMMRNAAVKRALAMKADYILMVDSDMIPDYMVGRDPRARPFWTTAWDFMMKRRDLELAEGPPGARMKEEVFRTYAPATIAAPYCGPPPHEICFIFRWKDFETDDPDRKFELEMIGREEAAYRSGIERAAALPTGLILYDARLFEQTRPKTGDDEPWFDYEWGDAERSVKATTEDVYQTRNAALLGYPQFVIWDSWAAHVKTKVVARPKLITADQVGRRLKDAVLAGRKSNGRVHMVHPHDPASEG